jgi:hypothetical protein
LAVYTIISQNFIQKFSRSSNERFSNDVFFLSRVLTDQHDSRVFWSFAGHGMSRTLPESAFSAIHYPFIQFF